VNASNSPTLTSLMVGRNLEVLNPNCASIAAEALLSARVA